MVLIERGGIRIYGAEMGMPTRLLCQRLPTKIADRGNGSTWSESTSNTKSSVVQRLWQQIDFVEAVVRYGCTDDQGGLMHCDTGCRVVGVDRCHQRVETDCGNAAAQSPPVCSRQGGTVRGDTHRSKSLEIRGVVVISVSDGRCTHQQHGDDRRECNFHTSEISGRRFPSAGQLVDPHSGIRMQGPR